MTMTIDECRKLAEHFFIGGGRCLWPDDVLANEAAKWERLCARLKAGERLDVGENMGSCQCGDIATEVFVKDGVVWCHSTGNMRWQRYDGPASDCHVSYRVGTRARELAMAYGIVYPDCASVSV